MLQFTPAKIALVVAVALMTLFFCAPNFVPKAVWQKGPDWWRPVVLGLDLQGGSRLLIEVDTGSVAKAQLTDLEETVRGTLRDAKIRVRNLHSDPTQNEVLVTLENAGDMTAARDEIGKVATGMTIDTQGDDRIRVTIPEKMIHDRALQAVSQSQEIVRRRIDPEGTSEAGVYQQGSDRIVVEMPGVDDPERARNLINKTANLTFHLVEPNVTSLDPRDLPPGTELLPEDKSGNMLPVRRRVEVPGDDLADASTGFQEGRPVVNFRFDTRGGRRFAQVTSDHVGDRLAIVLDGVVISAPSIKNPITGGNGYIEGNFTVESARDLAVLLRAGALPAKLNVIEQRSVGPGLGADSIKDGISAAILGGGLVIIFMIVAYHTFGVFAVVGQIFHMGTLFAMLSLFQGTLTLPGIAGAILSLGMAVDANVLIYERMREEQESGKTMLSSITSGFSHAYATIIDSNVTNLLAAILMFMLGAGPVQGFALTLFVGILTSMFSAVMVTRLQVWLWYRTGKRKELPI